MDPGEEDPRRCSTPLFAAVALERNRAGGGDLLPPPPLAWDSTAMEVNGGDDPRAVQKEVYFFYIWILDVQCSQISREVHREPPCGSSTATDCSWWRMATWAMRG